MSFKVLRYRWKQDSVSRRLVVIFIFLTAILWLSLGLSLLQGSRTSSLPQENPTSIPDRNVLSETSPSAFSIPQGLDPRSRAKWMTVMKWEAEITQSARESSLEPSLFAALVFIESGGWAGAESSAGAQGLAQVMPLHDCASWDPVENLACGADYLRQCMEWKNTTRDALACYNAGPGGADRGLGYDYADMVLAVYERMK